MFKAITIGGKEYHLEYTVEAALYGDATQKLMDFIIQTATASSSGDADRAAIIKENLRAVSDVPQTAMTLFYAGLLEHHGTFGDGTVKSLADAKRLVAQYFRDHAEDGHAEYKGKQDAVHMGPCPAGIINGCQAEVPPSDRMGTGGGRGRASSNRKSEKAVPPHRDGLKCA
jgi:hypothetical protein